MGYREDREGKIVGWTLAGMIVIAVCVAGFFVACAAELAI